VPPGHLVLTELPAEIDLALLEDGREVDQATVDVADDDPSFLHRQQQPAHLQKGLADLCAGLAAAVGRRRVGERGVGLLVGQQVAGVAQPLQQRLEGR
jgi:hypothetical protein